MGFDIYGLNPTEQGKPAPDRSLPVSKHDEWNRQYNEYYNQLGFYFRNNVWWWRRLADYIYDQCDDFLPHEDFNKWHDNGGHEVSKASAIKIADRMDKLIGTGHAKQHEKIIDKEIKKAEEHNEKINLELNVLKEKVIKKYGLKDPVPNNYPDDEKKEWDEIYSRKDNVSDYPFTVENLKEFIKFMRNSGGFRIC